VELRRLPAYERACRKLFTAQEQVRAELEIAADPSAWPVGRARRSRQVGRSTDPYFVLTRRGTIYLLFAYAKSVQEDIDESQKKSIRALAATLEREAG
jgi:hypothetical protein